MFALGNATFACGVRSARELSFKESSGETEVWKMPRRRHAHWCRGHAPGTQIKPQVELATSTGVVILETGQFLLLCSLQLWQQLQRCRQTRAISGVGVRLKVDGINIGGPLPSRPFPSLLPSPPLLFPAFPLPISLPFP